MVYEIDFLDADDYCISKPIGYYCTRVVLLYHLQEYRVKYLKRPPLTIPKQQGCSIGICSNRKFFRSFAHLPKMESQTAGDTRKARLFLSHSLISSRQDLIFLLKGGRLFCLPIVKYLVTFGLIVPFETKRAIRIGATWKHILS